MDATRSDVEFLSAVCEAAIRAGANTINIPDTVGYAIPSEFASLIQTSGRSSGDGKGDLERPLS